ncbi:MAG: SpaA isopeptide-forming pilin-related protein [Clostridium sp.]|nr:SpaA isopeptide-forming pilin-related protein [Clostridium sp.]MCM1550071.1 SpaA isopeptide-forming pilin-related protein [Clostridium sp.]
MKFNGKRFLAGFLAVLTIFTSLFANGSAVFAASQSSNLSFCNASVCDSGEVSELKAGFSHKKIIYAMIDGHTAYCMNFGMTAKNGQLMNSYENARTTLTDMQALYLRYCLYYGYSSTSADAPSNNQKDKYIATQTMVWIIEKGIFGTSAADSAAEKLCATAPDPINAYAYYVALKNCINTGINGTIPSFAASRVSKAETYELKWSEENQRFETVLTDSNGVLSEFDLSLAGYEVSRNGNTLTICSTEVNTEATTGTFTSNSGRIQLSGSCVFWLTDDPGAQEFISEVPSGDPLPAYIKVKTENIGYGRITKIDEASGVKLAGAVYGIYTDSGCTNLIQTMMTDAGGCAKSEALIAGTYYVKEISAPFGYVISNAVYTLEVKAGRTTDIIASDKRVTVKIHVNKVDKETGKAVPQGDAELTGAVYGLYARTDIIHPDGVTGTVFHAGELVATLTVDKDGNAEARNLYLGSYYLKEIKPSKGYLLDKTEYDIICEYEGDKEAEIAKSITSEEQVIKQPFQLIKVSDNGDDTEAPLLSGAGFSAYLKSSLPVKADGSYDFAGAVPAVIGKNGETILYTDEKGYLVTAPLPYGTYVVCEKVTPHNMETIAPFEVRITENNPAKPLVWRVFLDREFEAKLRVVKKDSKTGQTVLVPNTEFKIYNLNENEYVKMYTTYPSKVKHTSFFTDESGCLMLPEVLGIGKYRIEEVTAPDGYAVNTEYVTVEVDTNTFYETDPDTYEAVITVDYEDSPVLGELTVEKKGEVLSGCEGGLFTNFEDKQFVYKEGNLAGAEFEVYASEDIYTNDFQRDENGERTKYYSKGELVATITTGEDGRAVLSDIPLGTYTVKETKAPFGYVLNGEAQDVSFVYVDDRTPVIYESLTFSNDRQKVELAVEKQDAETKLPIAGAVFGLYADTDIVNAEDKVIVEAGTLLETAVSDENGRIAFEKDYPLGMYYAKEMEVPAGYVSSGEIVTFEAGYRGQDVETVKLESVYLNTPITFEFTKEDIASGAELSGATLSVIDEAGNIVETWTSKAGEAHVIKRLVAGKTYTLREEFAPYGYLKAVDVSFTVEDTEKVQNVEMKDEVPTGAIIINKDGEFLTDTNLVNDRWFSFIFDYFKKSLAGVTFEVYAAEDIISTDGLDTLYFEKDELVDTIVTNDRGAAMIEDLPLGRYYLVETKTLEGFVLDSTPIEADLSYVDQDTPVVYAGMYVTNERQKVQITVVKKETGTDEYLANAVFGLYAKEDIINADGKVLQKKDTLIEKRVTDKSGKAVFLSDLPLGQYYVKEIQAPAGYVKSDEIFDVDASYQDSKTKVLEFVAEFENEPIRVEISKTDITGECELEGAVLSIIDADGKIVEKWASEGKPHMIEKLPVGSYILREEAAPYGYKIANDVEFEVKETAEIQKVSMKDELMNGKIIIHKTNETTKEGIAGVTFEIRDKDGNVIETLVTDKNGNAESKELPIAVFKDGRYQEDIVYYVVETKAADGYILDSTPHEVKLRYDDVPEIVEYELSITNKPTEPRLPQTGDNLNMWLFGCMGAVLLAAGFVAFFWKRKKVKLG